MYSALSNFFGGFDSQKTWILDGRFSSLDGEFSSYVSTYFNPEHGDICLADTDLGFKAGSKLSDNRKIRFNPKLLRISNFQ